MMRRKVSVIMPVYNVEKYISKAIESVLNQTYTNFEFIIVDDGSPDKSIEIADQFNDDRIKIIKKENGGLSDARNFGMVAATGEFIYFIDSDDWIEENLLEIAVNSIETKNLNFVVFGYFLDNEDEFGNKLQSIKVSCNEILYSKESNNLELNAEKINLLGYAWNKLYRTDFLRKNQLVFEKGVSLVEDILFNSQVYEKSDAIFFLNKPLYHYINRPTGSLIKKFHQNSFDLFLKKKKYMESFLKTWQVNQIQKNTVLSEVVVNGIRYCVNNLYAFENELNDKEKKDYIKNIINNSETQSIVNYYKPVSLYDKIYKVLVKYKLAGVLALLCKINK